MCAVKVALNFLPIRKSSYWELFLFNCFSGFRARWASGVFCAHKVADSAHHREDHSDPMAVIHSPRAAIIVQVHVRALICGDSAQQ